MPCGSWSWVSCFSSARACNDFSQRKRFAMVVGIALLAIHISGRCRNFGWPLRPCMMNSIVTDSSFCMLGYPARLIFARMVLCAAMYSPRSPSSLIFVRCASCLRMRCVVGVELMKCVLISARRCRGVTLRFISFVPARSAGRLVIMIRRRNAHFFDIWHDKGS